jgi:hypothetical protein
MKISSSPILLLLLSTFTILGLCNVSTRFTAPTWLRTLAFPVEMDRIARGKLDLKGKLTVGLEPKSRWEWNRPDIVRVSIAFPPFLFLLERVLLLNSST